MNKTELSIVGGEILIILIYCFTYAALRCFPAVAVCQTLSKVEKTKRYRTLEWKTKTSNNTYKTKLKLKLEI